MELLKAGRALAVLACAAVLCARGQAATETAVKAAFLYKFAAYVEWPAPARPDTPFVIATLAADDVAAELATIVAGRAVAGRPTAVRKVKEGESLHDVQMFFVGRQAGDARATVAGARRNGVLVVTETTLEQGGTINFVVTDNRVSFEVSLEAAERGGHRISSRMLAVARRVVPKGAT
jgi:hypothetical protein